MTFEQKIDAAFWAIATILWGLEGSKLVACNRCEQQWDPEEIRP